LQVIWLFNEHQPLCAAESRVLAENKVTLPVILDGHFEFSRHGRSNLSPSARRLVPRAYRAKKLSYLKEYGNLADETVW
jgi:hypothetical protein